jgi:hypothetical protein
MLSGNDVIVEAEMVKGRSRIMGGRLDINSTREWIWLS